ncbi:hypothetical protein Tsubulata_018270 [Turnera subulata]|uniref:Uncharacterized protein n=1 Tax=Turnera subulata TaxID=218843 RepID=A0A9Q0GB57_9ROSI|nr:hypothetical protein Tsubulata_018270 [Turnera subulata]
MDCLQMRACPALLLLATRKLPPQSMLSLKLPWLIFAKGISSKTDCWFIHHVVCCKEQVTH